MMEPDLLGRGSNSFLIRMVGNLVEAGWPNAQGQWAWHHVATTRSRNLLIIPNGVYWQDASGTHVWFGLLTFGLSETDRLRLSDT